MKIKKIELLICCLMMAIVSFAQNPKAYVIYDAKGKQVDFNTMVDILSKKEVVFFGEMHNCALNHWLEVEVMEALYKAHPDGFAIGAEMFERDNQIIMDEYLKGIIPERSFDSEMRLWPNYQTDYVAMVDFAKENNLQLVASNVPRRYAKVVSRKGLKALDSLSVEAKSYFPPLPIEYKEDEDEVNMFRAMGGMMGHRENAQYTAQSQALKDATMAWWIADAFKGGVKYMLHFNGSYHSDNFGGIVHFLNIYEPKLSVGTIAACKQEDITKLGEESIDRADFIICIPMNMARSY